MKWTIHCMPCQLPASPVTIACGEFIVCWDDAPELPDAARFVYTATT